MIRQAKPQHRADGRRFEVGDTEMAMQVGAEMARACEALERETTGVEAASRAAEAARAAYAKLVDVAHPDSWCPNLQLVAQLTAQAYAMEWQRLMQVPREIWHR